jgi:HK97 family phage prohead protease
MKRFTIFAPRLKANNSDGKRRLHGVASSTVLDRHGDVITLKAMQRMEQAAKGMTIFFNHSYNVPEDVAGTVEKSEIRQHPTDPTIYDLVYDIVLNEANPRAINSWEAMNGGTQLGLSIGARIPEDGASRDANGVFTIDDIELLETSIVGVPASPRSWVEYAVKSLRSDYVEKTTSASKPVMVDIEEASDEAHPDDVVEETSAVDVDAEEPLTEILEGEGARTQREDDPSTNEETEPESEPTEDVTFSSDEVTTPQDAPESTPENGDELLGQSDAEETTAKAALGLTADTLKQANQTIVVLNRELDMAKSNKAAAEAQRDQVVSLTQKAMSDTASLLKRLSEAPQGRKTSPVVVETVTQFDSLKAVYGEGVMALLTKKETSPNG